jgi:hypothetical protein
MSISGGAAETKGEMTASEYHSPSSTVWLLLIASPLLVVYGWLLDYCFIGRLWSAGVILVRARVNLPDETALYLARYDCVRMALPFISGVLIVWAGYRMRSRLHVSGKKDFPKLYQVCYMTSFIISNLLVVAECNARELSGESSDRLMMPLGAVFSQSLPFVGRIGLQEEIRRTLGVGFGWNLNPVWAFALGIFVSRIISYWLLRLQSKELTNEPT